VLLAALAPTELDARLRSVALVGYTGRTVTSRDALRALLATVARDGYSLVDQELEVGLRSLAVPVRDLSGRVVAALNVSTHASRVACDELRTRCLPVLQAAARDLAQGLPA
jgi:IclR family pca regulon transcriptional regulator